METWIKGGLIFVESDVIRWTESVFQNPPSQRRKKKAVYVGKREVIAEVLASADARGFMKLRVQTCKAVSTREGFSVIGLKKNDELNRKQTTLCKGGLQRLKWRDEATRLLMESKFLIPDK